MLKKTITFEDFDGEMKSEVHYFNLTKSELIEMEVNGEGGSLAQELKNAGKGDAKQIMRMFKMIIGKSYGIREDGKFRKSQEISDEFMTSLAYDALFTECLTDAKKSADFVNGLIPRDLLELVQETEVAIETRELPQPEEVPWANREPTPEELRTMTREQLMEVYARKARA